MSGLAKLILKMLILSTSDVMFVLRNIIENELCHSFKSIVDIICSEFEKLSETQLISTSSNVEKLLNMLRGLDPEKDNLADNEEIQVIFTPLW